jgi:hypothetical protein
MDLIEMPEFNILGPYTTIFLLSVIAYQYVKFRNLKAWWWEGMLKVEELKLELEECIFDKAKIQEESKWLSLAAGELIHGLGNLIVDKRITLGELTHDDGVKLQLLGHALRRELISDNLEPELIETGLVDPETMTPAKVVDIADTIIINGTP